MVKVKNDLTGQRFGRLTVIEQAEDYVQPNGIKRAMWKCLCDCGNIKQLRGDSLCSGAVVSCGCFQRENAKITTYNAQKEFNTYDLSGEYGIGYTSKGEEFYFDLEDYDKIKDYCWYIDKTTKYVKSNIQNEGTVYFHRIVLDAKKGMDVDHIHGKETKNDNRKNNLRLCEHYRNCENRDIQSNNTSGGKGVNWNAHINKWESRITVKGETIKFGYYKNLNDAIDIRNKVEKKYFGEYSYEQSQKKGVNKMYTFNEKKIVKDIVEWLKSWEQENAKGCNFVVGISGGKDSSVVAALLTLAFGEDRVIGVLMPNGEQSDIDMARKLVEFLDIRNFEVNIKDAVCGVLNNLPFNGYDISEQTVTNLPARIRMATLYAISQSVNGRVANTCNLSEDWVGYATKYGDAAGDFSPLSQLTVTEVKAIGRELGLPSELVDKTPTDGLCGKTDEDNLGFTYAELDAYIRDGIEPSEEVKAKIDSMHEKNLFKLQPMPSFVYQA